MNEFDRPIHDDESAALRKPRLTLRGAMAATSLISVLLGLPFVQRLMAAGLGAILAAAGALIGLQLLAFFAFRCMGLLPSSETSRAT